MNKNYRKAKRNYWRRAKVSEVLDRFMVWGSSFLALCGDGKRNNWSVLFAQLFYTECPCCIFWRGLSIGFLCGAASMAAVFLAIFAGITAFF